jgi:hypothetical protein
MYSALPRHRAWWDTKLARNFGAQGSAIDLWIKHFFPLLVPMPANDRDHCRW